MEQGHFESRVISSLDEIKSSIGQIKTDIALLSLRVSTMNDSLQSHDKEIEALRAELRDIQKKQDAHEVRTNTYVRILGVVGTGPVLQMLYTLLRMFYGG